MENEPSTSLDNPTKIIKKKCGFTSTPLKALSTLSGAFQKTLVSTGLISSNLDSSIDSRSLERKDGSKEWRETTKELRLKLLQKRETQRATQTQESRSKKQEATQESNNGWKRHPLHTQ